MIAPVTANVRGAVRLDVLASAPVSAPWFRSRFAVCPLVSPEDSSGVAEAGSSKAVAVPMLDVGSNRTQPAPSKNSSVQACRSSDVLV